MNIIRCQKPGVVHKCLELKSGIQIDFIDKTKNLSAIFLSEEPYLDSKIRKFRFIDNDIYLMTYSGENIHIYSEKGDYLKSLRGILDGFDFDVGRITDFTVNKDLGIVYVSTNKGFILEYNTKLGLLSRYEKTSPAFNIFYFNGFLYILTKDRPNVLKVIKTSNFSLGEIYNISLGSEYSNLVANADPFIIIDDNIFLSVPGTDTIYMVDKMELSRSFCINNNSKEQVTDEIKKWASNFSQGPYNEKTLIPSGNLNRFSEYIIIELLRGRRKLLYDSSVGEMNLLTNDGEFDPLLMRGGFANFYNEGNYYYSIPDYEINYSLLAREYIKSNKNEFSYFLKDEVMPRISLNNNKENRMIFKFQLKN